MNNTTVVAARRTAQVVTAFHWLKVDKNRHITGCQCGYEATPDDCGYGDDVIRHIAETAAVIALEDYRSLYFGERSK